MDVIQQCIESIVEQELSRMLILLAMPRDDSYRNNEMDASTVGNGVDDSCTKSIMSNAQHSNFYKRYVMDASSVSNAWDDSCMGTLKHG
jgi:hypothetical protein